jgi:hypothetical protein
MNDEGKLLGLSLSALVRVIQGAAQGANAHDGIIVGGERCPVGKPRGTEGIIDKMPVGVCGRLAVVAHLVSPTAGLHKHIQAKGYLRSGVVSSGPGSVLGMGFQNLIHLALFRGAQPVVGDGGDEHMPGIVPSAGGLRGAARHYYAECGSKNRFHSGAMLFIRGAQAESFKQSKTIFEGRGIPDSGRVLVPRWKRVHKDPRRDFTIRITNYRTAISSLWGG